MGKVNISYPHPGRINPSCDLVDIIVKYKGKNLYGSVATPEFVRQRMTDYEKTRENARGAYFCAKGLVLVTSITSEIVQRTMDDLANTGDLEHYLHE